MSRGRFSPISHNTPLACKQARKVTGLASQLPQLLGQILLDPLLERQSTLGTVVLQDRLGKWHPAAVSRGKHDVPAPFLLLHHWPSSVTCTTSWMVPSGLAMSFVLPESLASFLRMSLFWSACKQHGMGVQTGHVIDGQHLISDPVG